jgi:predicted enzyme related to lactoylglutathione lyase
MAEISVFRPGDVSYLRIPAHNLAESAAFYAAVFGWKTDGGAGRFEDATGHIIGHFRTDLPVVGEAGVIPYVYVRDIDGTLASVQESGGELLTEPYAEGELWVAVTRDPAGNAIGVWQQGPRRRG